MVCLSAVADQATVAIDNARLFAQGGRRQAIEAHHRLASELHDSLSPAVFSMTIEIRATQLALESGESVDPTGAIGMRLARLGELAHGAQAELRSLIFEAGPKPCREEGPVAALRKHAAGLSARAGLPVAIEVPDIAADCPSTQRRSCTASAQKALSNVVQACRRTACPSPAVRRSQVAR